MTAKLVALILMTGATACGLLVIRQGRIDAAYEMSVVHRRMLQHEQSLWRMRVRVHELVRSDRVLELVAAYERELGIEMTPIRIDPSMLKPGGPPDESEPQFDPAAIHDPLDQQGGRDGEFDPQTRMAMRRKYE